MAVVHLETFIGAPTAIVFDLARDIEIHQASTAPSRERAIAGRTSGRLDPGDALILSARHFRVRWKMGIRITHFDRPHEFIDEMESGPFRALRHQHRFLESGSGTLMVDDFDFSSPFGPIGAFVDWLYLARYMRHFLQRRNEFLKAAAESTNTTLAKA